MKAIVDDGLFGKHCCARACIAKRDERYLFCAPHWAMIPPAVQRKLIRATGAFVKSEHAPETKAKLRDALNAAKACIDWAVSKADEDARRLARAHPQPARR